MQTWQNHKKHTNNKDKVKARILKAEVYIYFTYTHKLEIEILMDCLNNRLIVVKKGIS